MSRELPRWQITAGLRAWRSSAVRFGQGLRRPRRGNESRRERRRVRRIPQEPADQDDHQQRAAEQQDFAQLRTGPATVRKSPGRGWERIPGAKPVEISDDLLGPASRPGAIAGQAADRVRPPRCRHGKCPLLRAILAEGRTGEGNEQGGTLAHGSYNRGVARCHDPGSWCWRCACRRARADDPWLVDPGRAGAPGSAADLEQPRFGAAQDLTRSTVHHAAPGRKGGSGGGARNAAREGKRMTSALLRARTTHRMRERFGFITRRPHRSTR